jgi:hypothetical protein
MNHRFCLEILVKYDNFRYGLLVLTLLILLLLYEIRQDFPKVLDCSYQEKVKVVIRIWKLIFEHILFQRLVKIQPTEKAPKIKNQCSLKTFSTLLYISYKLNIE